MVRMSEKMSVVSSAAMGENEGNVFCAQFQQNFVSFAICQNPSKRQR
jgi:hypothetical protein